MSIKLSGRPRRHRRVRKKVSGGPDKPRLCVFRSQQHIYAQLIDDVAGKTLAAAGSTSPDLKKELGKKGRDMSAAELVGKLIAERAKARKVECVVFDRAGYKYHGRVKQLAEAARKAGLKF
ncbi:MAG: 50S ribosomal protein L18 [Planctomycetota bacterium]|jgi:large subunit ribosomal protein L18